ncbi:MAG: class D sortase [Vallitalea sp.]|jgi:sortase A|nr:class D sortase [Vallitalea sp.]
MRKVLSLVLIIVGVILISIPLIGRYRTKKLQQEMIQDFYAHSEPEANEEAIKLEENEILNDIFKWGDIEDNQSDITPIEVNTQINTQEETQEVLNNDSNDKTNNTSSDDNNNNTNNNAATNNNSNLKKKPKIKQKPKAIAVIKIDKIDVNLPIASGIDIETLKYAIGYMPNSGEFGEIGNAVLAGHRSHTYGVFFNRLNELENGDKIVINTKDKEYVYTVYEKKIVEPNDLTVMRGSSKFKVITLITCDPVIGATHRLIVHGVIE